MGAVCQYQLQKDSETYSNQEIYGHLPISNEFKPQTINNSIKHDLRVKYREIDCQCCNRPQMREIASQTEVSFQSKSQIITLTKNRSKPQKKKSKSKSKDSLIFDNYQTNKQFSLSQLSKIKNKSQYYKDQEKQKVQEKIVVIKSLNETIFNSQYQNKLKK